MSSVEPRKSGSTFSVNAQRLMRHAIGPLVLAILVLVTGCSDRGSRARGREVAPTTALDKMVVAFQGGHSKEHIQSKLNQAFRLYGVAITEDNYNRYGSVLVRLRKEIGGATEMEILDHTIRSHVPGVSAKLEDMMAISVVALRSGDR